MEDRLEEFRSRFLDGQSLYMLGEKKGKKKKGQQGSLAYQSLDDIYQMRQNTLRGSQLLIISKKPTTTVEMKKGASAQFNAVIQKNKVLQGRVRERLDILKKQVDEAKDENDPDTRRLITGYRSVTLKFKEAIEEWQDVQSEYGDYTKGEMKRQLKQGNTDLDEDEIQEIIRDPKAAESLLSSQVMGPHRNIANAVADIESKHKAILELDKNIEEVYQMFSDLQTMVHAQGTLIDSVEQNVRDARGYLEKSEGELSNAKRINKRKQWKICIAVSIIIVVLFVVIFVVIGVG